MPRKKIEPVARSIELPTFEGPSITERAPVDPPLAVGYRIYIRPRPPKQTSGLIQLARRTLKAQLAVCSIGQVIGLGQQAWKAGTPDLDPTKDAVAQTIQVGTWVHFRQHAGQKLKTGADVFASNDPSIDEFVLALADTDILGVFRDQAHADQFYDWV